MQAHIQYVCNPHTSKSLSYNLSSVCKNLGYITNENLQDTVLIVTYLNKFDYYKVFLFPGLA